MVAARDVVPAPLVAATDDDELLDLLLRQVRYNQLREHAFRANWLDVSAHQQILHVLRAQIREHIGIEGDFAGGAGVQGVLSLLRAKGLRTERIVRSDLSERLPRCISGCAKGAA